MGKEESRTDKFSRLLIRGVIEYILLQIPSCINCVRNSILIDQSFKYSNEEEARKDLELERRKLGLENLNIDLKFVDLTKYTAYVKGDLGRDIEIGLREWEAKSYATRE